jgi:sporulation protein YlmC with PRC-barrel domain
MKKLLTLAIVASTSLVGSSLYAADVTVKTDKHHQTEISSKHQCTAKSLLGATLKDSTGRKIGTIEDLVFDGDRVQFAVVKLNSDLAHGKAYTPIPISGIRPETMTTTSLNDQPRTYLLTVDRNKLETASRFNVERWPADQTTVVWGPEVYSHYGLGYGATGATGSDVYIQSGTDRGVEFKSDTEPPVNYQEKSVDNGTAPDGKTTFPYLHNQTDRR